MNNTELDLIEIEALKILVQPHRDNVFDSKRARFFKSIDRKLDLMAQKRSCSINKELELLKSKDHLLGEKTTQQP